METAAISKLKAFLSRYLLKVKAGEEIIVTDRGKPIAKITPLGRDDGTAAGHLLTLQQAGLARVGRDALPANFWTLPRPKDRTGLALRSLLQERENGR